MKCRRCKTNFDYDTYYGISSEMCRLQPAGRQGRDEDRLWARTQEALRKNITRL